MDSYSSFVAVGDSFTEGMGDDLPDGACRGWADLVAIRLAGETSDFRYANLAVRGKLIGQIVDEQVGVAAAMRPDLVSLAGGVNDLLRPNCDLHAVGERVRQGADLLAASAKRLLLFRPIDPSRRMRGGARLLPRVQRLIELVDELAEQHDAIVVDLFSTKVFDSPGLWAGDRIHLNGDGHLRVAEAVLRTLGRSPRFDWDAPIPPAPPVPRLARVRADLRWARVYLAPWIGRRLTGRSSGDGRLPKRPELSAFRTG